jgi:hypothetical protein
MSKLRHIGSWVLKLHSCSTALTLNASLRKAFVLALLLLLITQNSKEPHSTDIEITFYYLVLVEGTELRWNLFLL